MLSKSTLKGLSLKTSEDTRGMMVCRQTIGRDEGYLAMLHMVAYGIESHEEYYPSTSSKSIA